VEFYQNQVSDSNKRSLTPTDPRFAGFLGGGEIGYNHQLGKWVLGVEGDIGWTNTHGARPCPNGFFFNCEMEMN